MWRGHGVGARTVVIPNPPGDGAHPLKNVVVGPTHTAYVDIGSATNATPQGPGGGIPRASVLAYQPADKRVRVFATGIGNATPCRSPPTARCGPRSTRAMTSPTVPSRVTAQRPTPRAR